MAACIAAWPAALAIRVNPNATAIIDVLANDSDPDSSERSESPPANAAGAAGTASLDPLPFGFVNSEGVFVAYFGSPEDMPTRIEPGAAGASSAPFGTAYAEVLEQVSALEQAARNASSAAAAAQAEYDGSGGDQAYKQALLDAESRLEQAQDALEAGPGGVLQGFDGMIDELVIFDRPLSHDEMAHLASTEYYAAP